ncbi:MAG: hypothetical protein N3A38_09115, partial [Planctomycetota bacterium]|nr:hypothetical protein [Planctomycetota bacterium]
MSGGIEDDAPGAGAWRAHPWPGRKRSGGGGRSGNFAAGGGRQAAEFAWEHRGKIAVAVAVAAAAAYFFKAEGAAPYREWAKSRLRELAEWLGEARSKKVVRRESLSIPPPAPGEPLEVTMQRVREACGGDCESARIIMEEALPGGRLVPVPGYTRCNKGPLLHEAYAYRGKILD